MFQRLLPRLAPQVIRQAPRIYKHHSNNDRINELINIAILGFTIWIANLNVQRVELAKQNNSTIHQMLDELKKLNQKNF
jgi:hypothetical protein